MLNLPNGFLLLSEKQKYLFKYYAPISVFPQRGGGRGGEGSCTWELNVFENLGSNSLPFSHKCVSIFPWTCLIIYTEFLLEFQSKVHSLCQSVLSNSRWN